MPIVAFSLLLAVAGCGEATGRMVLVSAAASLTDAFTEIEARYEATHPGVDLVMNFGGSSSLREQILEGAPVDVFASADVSNMGRVVEAGLVEGEPVIFAENSLQIAVPAGNPAHVDGLDDFADEDLLVGVCAEGVPCGDFAREALANARVSAAIDTNEPDVRALLTKIAEGELDAGIVYITDVASSNGTVVGVSIPDEVNVVAQHPIAVMSGAPNPSDAAALVELVLSTEGRAILGEFGFTVP